MAMGFLIAWKLFLACYEFADAADTMLPCSEPEDGKSQAEGCRFEL